MSTTIYTSFCASSASLQKPSKLCHPLFASPEADVILRSLEGTLYRVSSSTLRSTSGLFSTMFGLPQPYKNHVIDKDCPIHREKAVEIDIYETDFVVEKILCFIHGFSTSDWHSIDDIEHVLNVAENWDAPKPISNIRSALSSPRFLDAHPLRIYAIARHFEWKEEARIASTHTLTLNLHDPCHELVLDRMSSKDILPLLNLHRKRRDRFKELINSPERFIAGNSIPFHCSQCGVTKIDTHPWREFKNAMFHEMDRRPLGDTLGSSADESEDWPEAKACWEARCPKDGCGGFNYDRVATLRQIQYCLELLPQVVEV